VAGEGSKALGSPEQAGTFVNPKDLTKKMTASAAGSVVGGAAGSFAASMATGGAGQYEGAPDFGRVGYLAVSDGELALVRTKSGLMKMKVTDEAIARVPRSGIASVVFDRGYKSELKITFTDGGSWEFDIPRANRKTAEQVVGALGGTVT
jgi:hypothetical protein